MINQFHEHLRNKIVKNENENDLRLFFEELLDKDIIPHDIYLKLESALDESIQNAFNEGKEDESTKENIIDETKDDIQDRLLECLSDAISPFSQPDEPTMSELKRMNENTKEVFYDIDTSSDEALKIMDLRFKTLYWYVKNFITDEL